MDPRPIRWDDRRALSLPKTLVRVALVWTRMVGILGPC